MASSGSDVPWRTMSTKDMSKWQLKKYIRWQARCKFQAGFGSERGLTQVKSLALDRLSKPSEDEPTLDDDQAVEAPTRTDVGVQTDLHMHDIQDAGGTGLAQDLSFPERESAIANDGPQSNTSYFHIGSDCEETDEEPLVNGGSREFWEYWAGIQRDFAEDMDQDTGGRCAGCGTRLKPQDSSYDQTFS